MAAVVTRNNRIIRIHEQSPLMVCTASASRGRVSRFQSREIPSGEKTWQVVSKPKDCQSRAKGGVLSPTKLNKIISPVAAPPTRNPLTAYLKLRSRILGKTVTIGTSSLCGMISVFTIASGASKERLVLRIAIRTVQQLLGHQDVQTTMLCLHMFNRPGVGVRSPADSVGALS